MRTKERTSTAMLFFMIKMVPNKQNSLHNLFHLDDNNSSIYLPELTNQLAIPLRLRGKKEEKKTIQTLSSSFLLRKSHDFR
jgi:hypothetical protein